MQVTGMELDSVTISIVLPMYAYLEALQHAKEIHGYNIRSALGFNSFVETSLIYMFVECACIEMHVLCLTKYLKEI
jgi:hypothetical protein